MSRRPRSLTLSSALTVVAATTLSGLALRAASLPPLADAQPTAVLTAQMKPMPKGMAMASGRFRKAEAPVKGGFTISEEGGKKVLTLSGDFMTSDTAPDLKVVFSPSATPLAMSKPPAYPLKAGRLHRAGQAQIQQGLPELRDPRLHRSEGPEIGADLV